MKLGHILVITTIDYQPVTRFRQSHLGCQVLYRGKEIAIEVIILLGQSFQATQGFLGNQENMHRVAGLGMMESDWSACFPQSFGWNGKAHTLKNPS
jgi:hypothetical protein